LQQPLSLVPGKTQTVAFQVGNLTNRSK
jgi:hypothetical protein